MGDDWRMGGEIQWFSGDRREDQSATIASLMLVG